MKVIKLKLGTHMDIGLMYHVYWNQGQGPITLEVTSFHRLYNLPLMKIFITDFFRNHESVKFKFGKYMDNGLMYLVYQSQGQELITLRVTSLDMFYHLPFMKNFCHTFLKNCKGL